MLRLALPVVLTYLGLMTMGLVDLICVGRVSAAAIGAVGVGTSIFAWFMIFGIGLLTGLEFLISHAYGAGKKEDCHLAWAQGIWISLLLGVPLQLVMLFISRHLNWFGLNPEVLPLCGDYLWILSFSLIPVYLFTASRQYLQAAGMARAALWILILANVLNALANWVLVLGHWGFPALSVNGSGIATLMARIFMCLAVLGYLANWDLRHHRYLKTLRLPWLTQPMSQLLRLGIPSALQMTFEVGVFAVVTMLAAKLSAPELAAHQIVLNLVSLTFMVPLGIGSATAMLVGQEVGRNHPRNATRMGWKGLSLGAGFMSLSALALFFLSGPIVGIYTSDPQILWIAQRILLVAALFQISDGVQTVATGALRGLAETHTPMLANLAGHWAMGLPLGVYLCFFQNHGLKGLWIGLSVGLTSVALMLTWRWSHLSRRINQPQL